MPIKHLLYVRHTMINKNRHGDTQIGKQIQTVVLCSEGNELKRIGGLVMRRSWPCEDVGEELSRRREQAGLACIKALRHKKLLCSQTRAKSLKKSVHGGMWQQMKKQVTAV